MIGYIFVCIGSKRTFMDQYEKDYQFQRKGKKYKVRYFSALQELFGEKNATDGEKEDECCIGKDRADTVCDVAKK